jgi:hypothetical protein
MSLCPVDRTGDRDTKEAIMIAQVPRRIAVLVVTLAAAVAMVGSARAEHPGDRAGMLGVGAVERASHEAAAVRPDDRDGLHGPGSVSVGDPEPALAVLADSSGGWRWADATSWGAVAAGLLVLGALVVGVRRNRSRVV